MELAPRGTIDDTIPRPTDPAALMALAFQGADAGAIITDRTVRAILDPTDVTALMDLSLLAQFQGRREAGIRHQAQALAIARLMRYPATKTEGLRLLMFTASGDIRVNTPIELILEDSDVSLFALYVRPGEPLPASVPDHDLALVGISEFDETHEILELLETITAAWPRPVLNAPGRIRALARDRLPKVLEGVPGLFCPPTVRVTRADLPPQGTYPIIIRPVGSHGGQELARLDSHAALGPYLAATSGRDFYIAPFIETGLDGRYRKYRIALIAGQPYLCHLAIGDHWMVSYQNAGMEQDAAKRDEERLAFANFGVFITRHGPALAGLADRIGLDYVVLDCADAIDGRLLLFEADNAAVIHDLDPPALFPYKHEPMQRAFAAFRSMLERRIGANTRSR